MKLTFRTLNGRFNLVIFSALILLLSVTLYAQYTVQLSASRSLESIATHRQLNQGLNHFRDSLQTTESMLYRYSTYLTADAHDALLLRMDELRVSTAALKPTYQENTADLLQDEREELYEATLQLENVIRRYIDIMQDVESRYPAMPILITHLEPTNRKFSEAVEQALQEGELTAARPNLVRSDHYRIMQLFQEARYAWAMQVSWFRIFVANRMGAFGEPETAMRNNLANRELFVNTVKTLLERLRSYQAKGMLGLQQEESLEQMQEAMSNYEEYLQKAIAIYFSDNWRADVALLRNELQPALDRLWMIALAIERAVADANKVGIDEAQNTASLLSYFIWFFTGIISLLLVGAYQVFQKKIRQPVLQLATSMDSHEDSSSTIPHAAGNVEEINRLIDAYTAMRQQVDNRQRRLQSILDNAAEGIITIDEHGCIETLNLAAQKLFDYDAYDLIGKPFTSLIMPDESGSNLTQQQLQFAKRQIDCSGQEHELLGKRRDGNSIFISIKFSEMVIADRLLYTAIVSDISERRAVIDHLRHLAEHDSLTGLNNRQYFNDALEHAFARSTRHQQSRCACIYIDLDNFKYINDTLGHLEGDRLLVGIANTLKARTRKSDILARLGGDEFALLLPDADKEQAATVANDYRQSITGYTFSAAGKHIDTGCSIGVAVYEPDMQNMEDLLARADFACHMAKRAGRNRVHVFEQTDKGHIDSFQTEMGWTRRIRHALEHDDFVFSCQPILNVGDSSIHSHELLLRMRDVETGSYIMPGGFLDSAERFGLMPDIDRWVVQHAFQWIRKNAYDDNVCYFIKLSGKAIGDNNLLELIEQISPSLGIKPDRVIFDIPEGIVISNPGQSKQFIHDLHQLGFKTALDDFGMGYSAFSGLRDLDVDYIKINSTFINSMHTDQLNLALVKAINDICHILGKKTIAEHVQNNQALRMLKEIGVDYAQGYNIANSSDYSHPSMELRITR